MQSATNHTPCHPTLQADGFTVYHCLEDDSVKQVAKIFAATIEGAMRHSMNNNPNRKGPVQDAEEMCKNQIYEQNVMRFGGPAHLKLTSKVKVGTQFRMPMLYDPRIRAENKAAAALQLQSEQLQYQLLQVTPLTGLTTSIPQPVLEPLPGNLAGLASPDTLPIIDAPTVYTTVVNANTIITTTDLAALAAPSHMTAIV
jgi:hypothetical protein